MDTVINSNFAKLMLAHSGAVILPPFYSHRQTCTNLVHTLQPWRENGGKLGLLIPLENDTIADIQQFYINQIDFVALDTLHNNPHNHLNFLHQLKDKWSDLEVISGNVVCAEDCETLIRSGADAIRVGMTAASINKGFELTGCGRNQPMAVYECSQVARKHDVPIISDGGISSIADALIALALGASTVMMGKLFAAIQESAAPTIYDNGQPYKKYKGMSRDNQISNELIPEAMTLLLPISGTFNDIISKWQTLIKIGFSRAGCRSISNLHKDAIIETN